MTTTAGDLIDQAAVRADMENSNFVTPAVWLTWLFDSYAELYDLLIGKFEDYYLLSTPITASNGSLALPADFYKLRGLDDSNGNPVKPFNFAERNNVTHGGVRYRIAGSSILLRPSSASGTYTAWYVPKPTRFTTRTDTIIGIDGWEVYIVVDMAIKALMKEESDVSELLMLKADIRKRIEEMAANRDAGSPQTVADVRPYDWC